MDIRKVKKLIEMLEESAISEIEIHEGEESVRISRYSTVEPVETVVQVPAGIEKSTTGTSETPSPGPMIQGKESGEPDITGHVITSPMVGIFYEAAAPDTPAFVKLGQPVTSGEVLCIIEAMKIMNQIESDADGVVTKILVENGEPVEYGQPLFVIT